MKKRIYGLETEYGTAFVDKSGKWTCEANGSCLHHEDQRRFSQSHSNQFMPNGSRIYIDTGIHPEYCTAECLSPSDLVAQDKAGEKMLEKIFNQHSDPDKDGRVRLFKNNSQYADIPEEADANGIPISIPITFGCHENFLTVKSLTSDALMPVFVPFLVVRQIIAGAGWVANREYQSTGTKYAISQRYRFITEKINSSTHGGWTRAILCTARWDEPLADAEKYRRLHLIVGDSNMSELSTYLKVSAIGILLDMLEEKYPFADRLASFLLENPVQALHLVSQDLTCKKPVIYLSNRKKISAIDLFWVYIEMMEEYERVQGLDQELLNALKVLIDVLQRLEKREMDQETLMEINSQGLDEELDWLLKKSILEDSLRQFNCDWNDFETTKVHSAEREISAYDQIRAKDKQYHDISARGLYNIYVAKPDLSPAELRAAGIRTPRVVRKEEIDNMKENPPQNTRAKIRGDLIRFLDANNLKHQFHINWDQIYASYYEPNRSSVSVSLKDPFAANSDELDKIKRAFN